MKDAGLKAVERDSPVDDEAQDGLVVDQAPAADIKADKDSQVVIFVGRFQSTDTLEQEPSSP